MRALPVVLGIGATVRAILVFGSLAGGAVALLRLTEEAAMSSRIGPPAWWVLLRKQLNPEPPPTSSRHRSATRVFQWRRNQWVALSPFAYGTGEMPSYLAGGPPSGRAIFAQARWTRKDGAVWTLDRVGYARDVKADLPR